VDSRFRSRRLVTAKSVPSGAAVEHSTFRKLLTGNVFSIGGRIRPVWWSESSRINPR